MPFIKEILLKGIFLRWKWKFGPKPKKEVKKPEKPEVKKPAEIPGIMS